MTKSKPDSDKQQAPRLPQQAGWYCSACQKHHAAQVEKVQLGEDRFICLPAWLRLRKAHFKSLNKKG